MLSLFFPFPKIAIALYVCTHTQISKLCFRQAIESVETADIFIPLYLSCSSLAHLCVRSLLLLAHFFFFFCCLLLYREVEALFFFFFFPCWFVTFCLFVCLFVCPPQLKKGITSALLVVQLFLLFLFFFFSPYSRRTTCDKVERGFALQLPIKLPLFKCVQCWCVEIKVVKKSFFFFLNFTYPLPCFGRELCLLTET